MEITREFIEANKDKRFNIELGNGVKLNRVGFFISVCENLCYKNSRQKRNGFLIPYRWDIKNIVEVKKKETSVLGNAKIILNRINVNAWTDIQTSLKGFINGGEKSSEFEYHWNGRLNFRNVTTLLNKTEQEEIKKAFQEKKEFRWSRRTSHHSGRDLSIHCNLCDDGIYRAWFSSEYMGCGNGDYYLLLSPTTAIYYERD